MKKSKSHDSGTESAAEQQEGTTIEGVELPDETACEDPMKTLQGILAAKENDFTALSDKYLRLAAEYDNFRKRSQKEKESLYTDSIALVIKELIPILDNLDRAELAASENDHPDVRKIADGISMIQKQVDQVLTRLGVSKIETIGQPFSPDLHEAVMHVEDDSVGPSTIVAELQAGYRREDRVIRHSMVKVAN